MSENSERSAGSEKTGAEGQEPERESRRDAIDGEIVDAEVTEVDGEHQIRTPAAAAGRGVWLALALGVIALSITAGGLWLGYAHWRTLQADLQAMNAALESATRQQEQLQQRLAETAGQVEEQRGQFESQRQALAQQDAKLAAERERLAGQGREMQQTLESVYQRVGRNSTAWMVAEAEYLLQVANHRLRLEQDPATAIRALQAADERLRDSGDPGWITVREQIAAEIAAIRAVDRIDRAGLSARLSGLARQVDELRMPGTEPMPPERPAPESAEPDGERGIDSLLKDSWEGFKSIMVIRHRGKPVSAMLPPDQQFFVQQNLRLKFESARMAMLRGDQRLYATSLQLAGQWLADFFEADAGPVRAMREAIDELAAVDVNPDFPDVSGSLMALRERMQQSAQGAAGQ